MASNDTVSIAGEERGWGSAGRYIKSRLIVAAFGFDQLRRE